jgi:hypothetical protein
MRCAGDVDLDVEHQRTRDARQVTSGSDRDVDGGFVYRPGMPTDPRRLAMLQRSAGNAAVATMLRPRPHVPVQRRAAPEATDETGQIDESVMIGESGAKKPGPPKTGGADDGKAGQASLQAAATGERAAIVADSLLANVRLDQQLMQAQGRVGQQVAAAKAVASLALTTATLNTQLFLAQKHAEVVGAATQAEQEATNQAVVMTTLAQGQAAVTAAQLHTTAAGMSAGLRNRVGGFADQIVGAISGISLPDLPGVSQVRGAITGLVRGAASGVTGGINLVQGLISRALSAGLGAVQRAIGAAGTAVTNVIHRVGSAIRTAATTVGRALLTIAGKVSQALGAFLRVVVFPALDRVRNVMSGHLVSGTRTAKAAVKTNTEYHLATLDKVAKSAVPAGGQQAGGGAAGGGGEDPVATFHSIGKSARENNQLVVNLFTGRVGAVIAGVAAMAMSGARQVADRVQGIASQVVSTIAGRVQDAIGLVRRIAGAVGGFLQSVSSSLRNAFTSATEWVRTLAANPVDELVAFGSKALGAARNFISAAIGNVLRGNFSLPSLGLGAFRPGVDAAGQGPEAASASAVTASFGSSATSVLSVVGAVVAGLAALVLLPFIIATVVGAALLAAAALVVFGPLLAVIALVLFGLYKLIKWIATPSKLEVTHTTDLQAPDGSPKTRVIVGVGERVMLKASKLSAFKATAGDPTSTAPKASVRWRAPLTPGSAEVTAEVVDKSMAEKIAFTVVAPSSVSPKKEKEKSFASGEQGAGMVLDFVYGPGNVSFGGVEARERSGPASDVKGYYEHEGQPHFHSATQAFFSIAENNQLAGETRDSASQFGMPKPWSNGSFHWDIPNEYRADETEAPKPIATVKQEFVLLDDTGTTTITKGGASVTRKP